MMQYYVFKLVKTGKKGLIEKKTSSIFSLLGKEFYDFFCWVMLGEYDESMMKINKYAAFLKYIVRKSHSLL